MATVKRFAMVVDEANNKLFKETGSSVVKTVKDTW
jgi:hypothetical protein